MRRPNKPHKDGYEDEEDCEGYYDSAEAERRKCHRMGGMSLRNPKDPCRICFESWKAKEDARLQAIEDAMTPDEKARRDEFLEGLRKLY